MFGEIDCREGLLLAVDKLKYDTMDEAVTVLVDIYADVLLRLITERGFEVALFGCDGLDLSTCPLYVLANVLLRPIAQCGLVACMCTPLTKLDLCDPGC